MRNFNLFNVAPVMSVTTDNYSLDGSTDDFSDLEKLAGSNIMILIAMVMILCCNADDDTIKNQVEAMTANHADVDALNTAGSALNCLIDPTLLVDINGKPITDYTTLINDYKNHPERLSDATKAGLLPFMKQLQTLKATDGTSFWDKITDTPEVNTTINSMLDTFMTGAASHLSSGTLIGFTTNTAGAYVINVENNKSNSSALSSDAQTKQQVSIAAQTRMDAEEATEKTHVSIGAKALSYYQDIMQKIFQ